VLTEHNVLVGNRLRQVFFLHKRGILGPCPAAILHPKPTTLLSEGYHPKIASIMIADSILF